jgi:hypothetical protein
MFNVSKHIPSNWCVTVANIAPSLQLSGSVSYRGGFTMKKVIKILVIGYSLLLSLQGNAATDEETAALLVSAKMAGACGILDQLIDFQATTKMDGGDELVTRFWNTEAARLGLTLVDLSDTCTRSIKIYDAIFQSLNTANSSDSSANAAAKDVQNFFSKNKVGDSPDYAFVKNGIGGPDHLITIHGYGDDKNVCELLAKEYNGDGQLSVLPGKYNCIQLNE